MRKILFEVREGDKRKAVFSDVLLMTDTDNPEREVVEYLERTEGIWKTDSFWKTHLIDFVEVL